MLTTIQRTIVHTKAIHIYNSLQPTLKPKIVKEYVFAYASKVAERKSQLPIE